MLMIADMEWFVCKGYGLFCARILIDFLRGLTDALALFLGSIDTAGLIKAIVEKLVPAQFLIHRNQAVPDGKLDQLRHIGNTQLLHHPAAVALNRLR